MSAYTEQEAQTKWCPFARYTEAGDDTSANRWAAYSNPEMSRCIGSACMAWRWHFKYHDGKPDGLGYCGLAGIPR